MIHIIFLKIKLKFVSSLSSHILSPYFLKFSDENISYLTIIIMHGGGGDGIVDFGNTP